MKKFRVVRGGVCPNTGKKWAFGLATYNAETAKDAVKQEAAEHRKLDPTFGGLMAPSKEKTSVVAVYEMVPVAESDWK